MMRMRLERVLSWLLLVGLLVAVLLMLTGTVLAGVEVGGEVGHESSVTDVPRALANLEPNGFFDLGLLVLLATPIARVLALLIGFSRRQAWLFSAVSLVVLVVLALSVVIGLC